MPAQGGEVLGEMGRLKARLRKQIAHGRRVIRRRGQQFETRIRAGWARALNRLALISYRGVCAGEIIAAWAFSSAKPETGHELMK